MSSLQNGEVLAVLPIGFGKSVFGIAERETGRSSCALLICLLKSIVSDQIAQLEGLCTAVELTAENISRVLEERVYLQFRRTSVGSICVNRLFQITQASCFEVMQICDVKSICEVHVN